jgi:hypothetical protein
MAASALRRTALALGLAVLAMFGPQGARADAEVDLALVIGVDISYSMDMDELALQRQGFAEAFRAAQVHDAIRRGMLGKIAVVYFEWAGAWDQRVVVPWTVLDGPDSAGSFAEKVAAQPVRRAQRTSISGAIDFGMKLLGESGVEATRRVMDISGDGPNNQGRPVVSARNEAVAQGVTINGLPVMLKSPGYLDIPALDVYYRDCVIGGQGAFVVLVREREQFPNAIKTKILLEIAGLAPPVPLVQRVQGAAPTDCMIGEQQWRNRMGN